MTSTPDPWPEPRFPAASRRALLRRSAFLGIAAATIPVLAACGGSSTSAPAAISSATTAGTATSIETPSTAPDGSTAATGSSSTIATGQAFPADARLQVNFTYEAAGGGSVDSPYIAVWIEDSAGDLVQTVSLWYKSDESKYLKDLKRWSSKNNSEALTTGATRIPGAYSVAWDGTNLDGTLVTDGDYFVCIEAAREDGPYQLIREAIPVSGSLTPTTLTANGELTTASVELVS